MQANFHEDFLKMRKTPEKVAEIMQFMEDLCMIIDQAIRDRDTWLTIGQNKGYSKVMLTLHQGDDEVVVVGTHLADFLADAKNL